MRKGFTLLEIIIYVAILALMAVFVMGIVMQVGESVVRNRARVSVVNEADFIMRKIGWAMTGASDVTEPTGTSTGSRISIKKFNYPENPIVISSASGTVFISRGGSAQVRLSSPDVKADSLVFTGFPATAVTARSVLVSLSLSASSSDPKIRSSTTIESIFYFRQ